MIFNDYYTVHEKYSLVRQERICSYSEMPWLYTTLVDDQYKPSFDSITKERLNKALGFKYFIGNKDTIKKELHFLGINHTNKTDGIIDYRTRFRYNWAIVNNSEKNHFIGSTGTSHLQEVHDKISQLVTPTRNGESWYTGMRHDATGLAKSIEITDTEYDVSMYNNTMLTELNDYSKRNYTFIHGVLNVGLDDKVSMVCRLAYPQKITRTNPQSLVVTNPQLYRNKINISAEQATNRHLFGMRQYDFLTLDQINYIYDEIYIADHDHDTRRRTWIHEDFENRKNNNNSDFRIDLEFQFTGDQLDDIICSRVLFHKFKDVERSRPWTAENEASRSNPVVFFPNRTRSSNYK